VQSQIGTERVEQERCEEKRLWLMVQDVPHPPDIPYECVVVAAVRAGKRRRRM
jgi:hypothetical protein